MGKICKSADYDIIHANSWNGYAFSGLKPLVLTCHLVVSDPTYTHYRTLSQHMYHSLIYKFEKQGFSVADKTICISQDMQKQIEQIYGHSDSLLIYNGVDESVFKPEIFDRQSLCKKFGIPPEKKILFFSGNPTKRKGGDLLPGIMDELGDEYVLALTGGLRQERASNNPNVITVGKVGLCELISLYNLSEIFLFPTRLEGFCLSILEAMSCGKPVVSTNTSSLPEQIINGRGGILCPMDDVPAFAEAVRYLTENEDLTKKMGDYNRQRVLDFFTQKRMTDEYIKVYKKLL